MVKRIRVHPTWDGAALLTLLENGNPKMLPYVDTFDQDRGWLTTWGPFHIEDSALTLSTELDAGGASVILDGTRHWENYTVRVDAVSPERTSLNIIVRYKDNDNHAQCNIGNGFAHVEQIIAGERRTIRGERSPAIAIPEGPFTMEATVDGRTVICSLNGSVLVESDFLDRSLETGGVGIKIWDEAPGRASVEVDMLTVSEIQSSSSASGI